MGGVLDEQTQTIIKPRFYPRLCQFLTKIIPVLTVCALASGRLLKMITFQGVGRGGRGVQ